VGLEPASCDWCGFAHVEQNKKLYFEKKSAGGWEPRSALFWAQHRHWESAQNALCIEFQREKKKLAFTYFHLPHLQAEAAAASCNEPPLKGFISGRQESLTALSCFPAMPLSPPGTALRPSSGLAELVTSHASC